MSGQFNTARQVFTSLEYLPECNRDGRVFSYGDVSVVRAVHEAFQKILEGPCADCLILAKLGEQASHAAYAYAEILHSVEHDLVVAMPPTPEDTEPTFNPLAAIPSDRLSAITPVIAANLDRVEQVALDTIEALEKRIEGCHGPFINENPYIDPRGNENTIVTQTCASPYVLEDIGSDYVLPAYAWRQDNPLFDN